MAVNPIPDNFPRVIPYLIVNNVSQQLDFLTKVFNAKITELMELEDGTINHAECRIGDSVIMMGKASEDYPPMPAMIYVYMEDTDDVYNKALSHGAISLVEPADQFYGDRNAGVKDPFGNSWWIATHVKDVTKEEMERMNKEKS